MSLFDLVLVLVFPKSYEEPILRFDRLEVAVRSGVHEFGSRTNQYHSTSTSAEGRSHVVPNIANPARSRRTPSATRPQPGPPKLSAARLVWRMTYTHITAEGRTTVL